jgi:hypothetical protein
MKALEKEKKIQQINWDELFQQYRLDLISKLKNKTLDYFKRLLGFPISIVYNRNREHALKQLLGVEGYCIYIQSAKKEHIVENMS